MEAITVSKLTETLVNILIGGFSLVTLGMAISLVQSMIYDHRREEREKQKAAQEEAYHQKRMKELDR